MLMIELWERFFQGNTKGTGKVLDTNLQELQLEKYVPISVTNQIMEIPNVTRDDLAALLPELDFKIGVEVGVASGQYSKVISDCNPQMKLYGIDPWASYSDYKDYVKKEDKTSIFGPYIENGSYKVAKLIGLGYPGGPRVEKMAQAVGFKDFFNCFNTSVPNRGLRIHPSRKPHP